MVRPTALFCLAACAAGAWAQPGSRSGAQAVDAAPAARGPALAMEAPYPQSRDERRTGLREVLRPPRGGQAGGELNTASVEPSAAARHLTPQERAELRELLRREQSDFRRQRP